MVNGANSKVASDFEAIIHAARDRKKNESLAAKIFGKNGRTNAPLKTTSKSGGLLISRAGIVKRGAAGRRSHPGNIDGEWTHDLHVAHSVPSTVRGSGSGSLASRITKPNAAAPRHQGKKQQRRAAYIAQALERQRDRRGSRSGGGELCIGHKGRALGKGMQIRGLAGPFVVMAQNLAPGTTAADVESAMTPVGGIISCCRIVKTQPIVICEMVFESKEGADKVIETFNNKTADGRVIQIYYKVGGSVSSNSPRHARAPVAPRSRRNNRVIDGSLGFDDPMDTDMNVDADYASGGRKGDWNPPTRPAAMHSDSGGLYSDRMVRPDRRGWGWGAQEYGGGSGR